jgi:hypothetical protein
VKASAKGWLVTVRVTGKLRGAATWQVAGRKATPANALARAIARRCR